MLARLALSSLVAALSAACQIAPDPASPAPGGFQMRSDADAALNAPFRTAPVRVAAVAADAPFRLRMAARAGSEPTRLALEYRRNDGPWTAVKAHDFPLPERELSLDFAELEAGEASSFIRESGGLVFVEAPWPLDAFSFAADLTLPLDGSAALVFGFQSPQDHARLTLDPGSGVMRLERVQNGEVRTLAQTAAPVAPGARVVVEVQAEDGVLEAEVGDGAAFLSLPRPRALPAEALGLDVSAAGSEIHAVDLSGEASTPRVSIVESPAFSHGALTRPVFAGDAAGFAVSMRPFTPVWRASPGAVGEFVWPLVIRRFADGAVMNEAGDMFEFRLVTPDGERANIGPNPLITLEVAPGHLGGTYVETPGRIGPFLSAAGALYFIMEPAETDNLFMMVRSEDGGASWREVDGANRPATGDLEAVDARVVEGTIHIVHQITERVLHHAFDTGADRWVITDEVAAEDEAVSQMATLAVRSDGSMVSVFLGDRLYYAVRDREGRWSPAEPLDPQAEVTTVGPQAITGADDAVHIAYADGAGAIWLRTLSAQGAMGARTRIAEGAVSGEHDYGAVLPLVDLDETGTLVIAYRLANGTLLERRLSGDRLTDPAAITAGPVITNAVDSQQAAADLVAHGETLHALFVDADTRALYSAHDCGSGWSDPVLRVDGIRGSWVRGLVHTRPDGSPVYRYVYDAGSNGGSGLNRYGEIALTMCE